MSTTNALNINDDGIPVFTASTGQFAAAELTTKGDILTRTTSLYTRLGVGADGEFLTPDSGETTGLAYDTKVSGSNITFIASQTAAASSSVNFATGWDDSIYAYYIFTYTNVRPSSDGQDFWLRVSVNGGSTYLTTAYFWTTLRTSSSDGADNHAGTASDTKIRIIEDLGNAAGEGISGKILYFPSVTPSSDTPSTFAFDQTVFRDNGTMYRAWGNGMNETTSVINGVRFLMSSGNVATGVFKFYGVTFS